MPDALNLKFDTGKWGYLDHPCYFNDLIQNDDDDDDRDDVVKNDIEREIKMLLGY
jgi:hypothetical protein